MRKKKTNFQELFKDTVDTLTSVPKNYYSVEEIAEELGLANSTTRTKLREAHKAGKIDRVKVRVKGTILNYYKMKGVK